MSKSDVEDELAFQLTHATPYHFTRQYRFHLTREWRNDFAVYPSKEWVGRPLLVEIEGAIRGKPGRHQRVDGMTEDCEKYAEAMFIGYHVLRVMPSHVRSGVALQWIERMMARLAEEAER